MWQFVINLAPVFKEIDRELVKELVEKDLVKNLDPKVFSIPDGTYTKISRKIPTPQIKTLWQNFFPP